MGPGVGGGGGWVTGGSLGLGVGSSAKGGRPGLVGSVTGVIGSPGCDGCISDMGEDVGGLSVSTALHP